MKVGLDKVQLGLTKFIDSEMINHLEGWKKIGFGAGAALIIKNLPNTLQVYANHPFIAMLGVIDENGKIDIDALHDAVVDYFSENGDYVNIPLLGRVKITKEDIENLYKYIKEA